MIRQYSRLACGFHTQIEKCHRVVTHSVGVDIFTIGLAVWTIPYCKFCVLHVLIMCFMLHVLSLSFYPQ